MFKKGVTIVCFIVVNFYNFFQLTESLVLAKADTVTQLPHFNVHANLVSLSGFSSGGTMAQQLLVSYSSQFIGAGVFSHTYYRCGNTDGDSPTYDLLCTQLDNTDTTKYYDPALAVQDIQTYFNQSIIEDPQNLATKKLYVYTGTKNFLFSALQSLRIVDVLGTYIPVESIRTRVQAANSLLPSATFGGACAADATANYSIANCGISGPYDALSFLLKPHHITQPKANLHLQPLLSFDQSEFFTETVFNSMDTVGFYYIPTKCRCSEKCLVHFYFHGCLVGREYVGDNHILNSGYLELAEENGIIMVFPQVVSSTNNPIGCWDTFGVTGPLYATQKGVQVGIVFEMVKRVVGN